MNCAWGDGNNYNDDNNNCNNNPYYYNNDNNDDDDDDDDDEDDNDNGTGNDEGNNNNNNPPARNAVAAKQQQQQRVKKGKGRQKITMAKIKTDSNLQVTFSKRRAGVFKKASELSTLCGAESTIVIFSPGKKPHSFGHPSVEAVASRFLEGSGNVDPPPLSNADQLIMAHGEAARDQRTRELIAVEAELERERQHKNELMFSQQQQLENYDLEHLDLLKKCVLGFKEELEQRLRDAPVAPPYLAPPPPYGNNPHDPMMNNPIINNPMMNNPMMNNPMMNNLMMNNHGGSFPPMPYGGSSAMAPYGSSSNMPYGSSSTMPFGSSSVMEPYGSSSGASSSRPPVNYGYMVQYPDPFGAGSSSGGGNYGDPSAMVPYEAGTVIPDEEDSGEAAPEENPSHHFQGYGGNYYSGPNHF